MEMQRQPRRTVEMSRDVSAPPQPAPGAKTRPHAPAQPRQRSAGFEPEVEDSLHGSSVDVQVHTGFNFCFPSKFHCFSSYFTEVASLLSCFPAVASSVLVQEQSSMILHKASRLRKAVSVG